jgi:hypothetical protein
MHGFVAVEAMEEEPVRTGNARDSWHVALAPSVMMSSLAIHQIRFNDYFIAQIHHVRLTNRDRPAYRRRSRDARSITATARIRKSTQAIDRSIHVASREFRRRRPCPQSGFPRTHRSNDGDRHPRARRHPASRRRRWMVSIAADSERGASERHTIHGAGSRVERECAATQVCAIRDARISTDGACRDQAPMDEAGSRRAHP